MAYGILIMVVGAFSILGAAMDFEWFRGHRKAQLFVRLMGRNGARMLYGLLGVVLVVGGAWLALTR